MKIQLQLSSVSGRYIKGYIENDTLPDDILKALNIDTSQVENVTFEGEFSIVAYHDEAYVDEIYLTLIHGDNFVHIDNDSRFDMQDLASHIESRSNIGHWIEESKLAQYEPENYERD